MLISWQRPLHGHDGGHMRLPTYEILLVHPAPSCSQKNRSTTLSVLLAPKPQHKTPKPPRGNGNIGWSRCKVSHLQAFALKFVPEGGLSRPERSPWLCPDCRSHCMGQKMPEKNEKNPHREGSKVGQSWLSGSCNLLDG